VVKHLGDGRPKKVDEGAPLRVLRDLGDVVRVAELRALVVDVLNNNNNKKNGEYIINFLENIHMNVGLCGMGQQKASDAVPSAK
jgi:hypothetical protein